MRGWPRILLGWLLGMLAAYVVVWAFGIEAEGAKMAVGGAGALLGMALAMTTEPW